MRIVSSLFIVAFVASSLGTPTLIDKDFECAEWPKWLFENNARIVNGNKANLGDLPWQVQLIDNGEPGCGGTLISSKHVLTAAHCLPWQKEEDITVISGRLNVSKNEPQQVTSKVAKIFLHEDFNQPSWYNNDIALLELEEPIQFNKYINMACIGTKDPADGTDTVIVSGWGIGSGNTLHWTNLTIVPRDQCRKIVDSNPPDKPHPGLKITNQMLCAADIDGMGKPSSGCFGDSGGPLVMNVNGKATVVGIVSDGATTCGTSSDWITPNFYANVANFTDWLQERMCMDDGTAMNYEDY